MDEERSGAHPRVGKVIKGEGSAEPAAERSVQRPPVRGVLNAEQYEAITAAQKIVEEAKRQAKEIIDQAQLEKEDVFQKAREEARAEVSAQATAELAKAKMQAGQILAAAEPELLALSLKVAEKIVGRDLERQPEVLLEICATAIESARNVKAMVLKVNPRDGKLLREKRPALMELVGRSVDIAVKDDAEVRPGGCVIETEFGTIDAELKTQLEMLKLVLLPDTARKEVK